MIAKVDNIASETNMAATYTVVHVAGWGGTDHFGAEIARMVQGVYPDLSSCRQALRQANHNPGRFDIARSDGELFRWES